MAPCDFNSLNKLAQGIADNLALSVVAEAIGRRTPVAVAISVNAPLWAHPRAGRIGGDAAGMGLPSAGAGRTRWQHDARAG